MINFRISLLIIFLLNSSLAFNEEKNTKTENHNEIGASTKKDEHDDHKESGKEDGHDKHQEKEHEEENSNVGPEKGILKADEEKGFILSPEASKNFGIKTMKLVGVGPWTVPISARMFSKEEVNLYRIRNGFIKRIDFKLISKIGSFVKILSSDLTTGDEIITNGVGFVRIAELTAFGGAPEGHSH